MNMNKGSILNQSYSMYTLFISKCYDSAIASLCILAVNTINRSRGYVMARVFIIKSLRLIIKPRDERFTY